jgi:4-amino-4-deoxy-L-arabinose transferase-like glycosyltransferase
MTLKSRRWFWLLIALFLLWVVIVLASYYVVQNAYLGPIYEALGGRIQWRVPAVSGTALIRSALDLLAAIWILFIALGIGRWVLGRLKLVDLSPLEEVLFALGIGSGALGLTVLFLGLAGLIQQPLIFGLAVLLTLASGRANLVFLRSLTMPRPRVAVALFLAATAGLALTLALLPPTEWDSLFYHLTGPAQYLTEGQIRPGPDIPHLNFPALMEMNFLLAMVIRSDTTAVLLHLAFGLLLVGLVHALAKEVLGVKNGWLSVLFLLSIPMVFSLAGWAYNDLTLAFYQVAALYALLKWHGQRAAELEGEGKGSGFWTRLRGEGWLILAGLMCGLAMGVKYTSFVAPLTLLALLLWWHRRELSRLIWPAAVMLGVAVLVAAPWYVKNLAFTGNPVYPFVFGGRDWDDFRGAAYAEARTGIAFDPATCMGGVTEHLVGQHPQGCEFSPIYLVRRLLTLPYDLTLGLRDASRDGDPGPLFLLLLPLLVAYVLFRPNGKRPEGFNALLFFALIQYLFWTVGVIQSASLWQSRLLLPALVALCPAMAWLLEDLARFDRPKFSLQSQLFLVIGLVLLLGLAIRFVYWLPEQSWTYLVGDELLDKNLQRRLGYHYQAMQAVNDLPPDAVVTFLWEPRSYYCLRDCRPDSILDEFGHLTYQYGNAEAIAKAWRADGVSHLLLYQAGLDLILKAKSADNEPLTEPKVLRELRSKHLQLVETIGENVYQLLALRP